jgi:phasin family protein
MPQTKTSAYAKDFAPFLADLKVPNIDVETVVASHRKNVETLIEANRRALDGVRAVTQRQVELVREGFERASEVAAEAMAPEAPEKKLARQAELAKDAFDAGLANYRELYDLAAKASESVFELWTKRISDSFEEFRAVSNGAAESAKDAADHAKKAAKSA